MVPGTSSLITSATDPYAVAFLEECLAHPEPEYSRTRLSIFLKHHRVGPAVPDGFSPSHPAAFVHNEQVWTSQRGYAVLVERLQLGDRSRFITRGLGTVARRWQPMGGATRLKYNLSVIRYATTRPGFDTWFVSLPENGVTTLRDLKTFLSRLQDTGVIPE
jgi:hypothetical protein